MTARTEMVARIAEVLAGHYRRFTAGCSCGFVFNNTGTSVGIRPEGNALHRAHVADVLADVCADVWDEGHDAARERVTLNYADSLAHNPYRVSGDER